MDDGVGQKKKNGYAEVNHLAFMFPADELITQNIQYRKTIYLKILPRAPANSVDPLLAVN